MKGGSAGKESPCNAGDLSLIPGLGGSPGEGKGYPLQYSGLDFSINCIVHGAAKSRTRLNDFHFHVLGILHHSPQISTSMSMLPMRQFSLKSMETTM